MDTVELPDARTAQGTGFNRGSSALAKLRQVEVLTSQGRPVSEAIRSIGVTEVTFYRWRQE